MPNNPIDKHVGQQIRAIRKAMGITQSDLGKLIGVTFQQVQKYEKGTNRIGSSRLYEISKTLNTSVGSFFEGLDNNLQEGFAEQPSKYQYHNVDSKEIDELISLFTNIEQESIRKDIINIVKTLSDKSS